MANENETENRSKGPGFIHHYNFEMYQNKKCEYHGEWFFPEARSGHRIVCNDKYVYVFGGYNPDVVTDDGAVGDLLHELWQYNIDSKIWDKLECENIPEAVASPAVILDEKYLLVLGGSGYPFGQSTNNDLFVCDLEAVPRKFQVVPTTGEKPPPSYGHCMLRDEEYLYTVGGTSGFDYHIDVHRLNLRTKVWEPVFISKYAAEPKPRYRHECTLFNKKIYVFGGGLANHEIFGFKKLPVFNLETFKWSLEKTHGDTSLLEEEQYPKERKCHGCVQKPNNMAQVFITGGCSALHELQLEPQSDCWIIDLNTMTWTRMPSLDLKFAAYFHSSAVTPSGKMYTYGGIIHRDDGTVGRTGEMFESWIQVPSLKKMCWEAVQKFIKDDEYLKRALMENPHLQNSINSE